MRQHLEMLLADSESRHREIELLFESITALREVAKEHTAQLQEHTKQLEIDAENIRRLDNIAAAHEQRLDDLEGLPGNNGET